VKLVDGDALYVAENHQSPEKYRVLTQEHAPVTIGTMRYNEYTNNEVLSQDMKNGKLIHSLR
jgi:hypothetical protein